MRPRHLPIALRRGAARAVVGILLSTPAATLAAQPLAKPEAPEPAVEVNDARLARSFSGAKRNVARLVRRERQPAHPVAAPVDYGSAEAAFGNARGRPHQGQDVFAPAGTKLVAPRDAVVVGAGSDGGRGNWAALYDSGRELTYVYFHMSGPAAVAVGEKVPAGRKVGEVGCTGSCWGDHLHFELRRGRGPYGPAIDPMSLLERASPAR